MSTRRTRTKKARSAETEPLLNDVLDASAAPPMLSPPPSDVVSSVRVASIDEELALVDAAWDDLLA